MQWRACLKVLEVEVPIRRLHGVTLRNYSLLKAPLDVLEHLYEESKLQFRRLVKIHHPDKGGNPDRFLAISFAWNYLKIWFAKRFSTF